MKKFLSIILSLVMIMSLSVTAFADEINSTAEGSNSANTDVKGTYTPTYSITVTTPENGTVTADKTNAAAGDTVTLTVTPATNYELETLTYTPTGGTATAITAKEGEYSFTMPDANVTIDATFKSTVVTAEITGMTVTVENETSYDESTKTYTVGNSATITITVMGTNFDKLTDANKFKYGNTEGTVTQMIVDKTNNTATLTIQGSALSSETSAIGFYYSNNGATNWTECAEGTKVLYQQPTISVSITWGSMSFTYYDAADAANGIVEGWNCAEGANKITVSNNGSQDVTASVTYTAEETYKDVISGSFDVTSADVTSGTSKDFTLTLSGKPAAALNDVKIGTVTVTIGKVADPILLHFTFVDDTATIYRHARHKISFYDVSGDLIIITDSCNTLTETVTVPADAATFNIELDCKDTESSPPIDWNPTTSAKEDVPEVTSNVTVSLSGRSVGQIVIAVAE